MRSDTWSTAFRVAFVTLILVNVVYTSKKQKRQLFREHLLPYFGGKIPDSAFLADRLSLNMLNKEGISVPDGILLEARPKESFHQSSRNDPELSNSIIKMVHTSDGRFVPSEGQHSESDNEVETTYKILLPENFRNYQLPKFRPIPEPLQLPIRPQLHENAFSMTPVRGQFGAPFFAIPQGWNLHNTHTPNIDQFSANKIINIQQNFNTIRLTGFLCDRSGKMYPDPETQCQVFHLCHYNGYKETFVCPQGTRYDPTVQECRIWYTTPCLNSNRRRPY